MGVRSQIHDVTNGLSPSYEKYGMYATRRPQPRRKRQGSTHTFLFRDDLTALGYTECAAKSFPAHKCKGQLVVDHAHDGADCYHIPKNACPNCVRGLVCNWGNASLAVWDELYATEPHLVPAPIAEYIERRPLL